MSFQQLALICFAAGSMIHGVFLVLVAKLWRNRSGAERTEALEGLAISSATFLWQLGNFVCVFALSIGYRQGDSLYQAGLFARDTALLSFPLLFSYMCLHVKEGAGAARYLVLFGRVLRYPLLLWTALTILKVMDSEIGEFVSLHLMLVYFVIFTVAGVLRRREAAASGVRAHMRAHRATTVAAFLGAGLFVLMLSGYWGTRNQYLPFIELAAMMTSVPFTIATAYRLYQFPFMDVFVREALSGVLLLAAFAAALALETRMSGDLVVLSIAATALVLAYAKEPLTRWVERTFMGYEESAEEQEERIGTAIRALTQIDEFGGRVSEILASELEADWVEIASTPRPDAVHRFEIPGSSALWMSIGPRVGGRRYMSRELRIARTAALQLAAHHHQLSQHELRNLTARAQMRALQAQINPHFLFNTLNVLANLIHTNPAKAEHVTEELAEIFRYALESTRLEWVKVDDELHFLESYLEIEKARFEERLVYSIDVDAAIRALRIPPMILQPLVENAVKHGIGPKVEGGAVRISGRYDADRLVLVVEDTGAGPAGKSRQRGAGIGLNNVRERLQHVYGDSASLRLEEMQPEGTRAVLVLPQFVGVPS